MELLPSSSTAPTSFQPHSSSMATHSTNNYTEQRPPSPSLAARSSIESSSATKPTIVRSDSFSQGEPDTDGLSNAFDENAIRVLLDMDVSIAANNAFCSLSNYKVWSQLPVRSYQAGYGIGKGEYIQISGATPCSNAYRKLQFFSRSEPLSKEI
jgi:hypothetical protein